MVKVMVMGHGNSLILNFIDNSVGMILDMQNVRIVPCCMEKGKLLPWILVLNQG